MDDDPRGLVSRWQKACLAITLIFTAPYLIAFFQKRYMLPRGADDLLSTAVGILVFWSPLIFHWIGLRATSSISASVLGMLYFGGALFGILTPGFPKIYTLLFFLMAVFYYFYSTKTWQAHELSWRLAQRKRTEEGR